MTVRAILVLGTGILSLITAMATGARFYYIIALSLFVLLFYTLICDIAVLRLMKFNLKGISKNVERGEGLTYEVSVNNIPIPGSYLITLTFFEPDGTQDNTVRVRLPFFKPSEYTHELVFAHRGEYQIGIGAMRITDAFNLFSFEKNANGLLFTVQVSPKDKPMKPAPIQPGDIGKSTRVRMEDDRFSPSGVRNYKDGDTLKKIHWKLTMKRNEVMVRVYDEAAKPDTLIIPDLTPKEASKKTSLFIEDAVCEATLGLSKAQLNADCPVRVSLINDTPTELMLNDLSDLESLKKALTQVKFDSEQRFAETVASINSRLERIGACIIVTSEATPELTEACLSLKALGLSVTLIKICDLSDNLNNETTARLMASGINITRVNTEEM